MTAWSDLKIVSKANQMTIDRKRRKKS